MVACVSFLWVLSQLFFFCGVVPHWDGCVSRLSIKAKSSTNRAGRGLGLGFQRGGLENKFRTSQPRPDGRLVQGDCLQSVKTLCCICILTYNIENLWQGLRRHQFILEGPEHSLWGLIDWHVVVTNIFCQWERPAPLCVAGRDFLYVMKTARRLLLEAKISSKSPLG